MSIAAFNYPINYNSSLPVPSAGSAPAFLPSPSLSPSTSAASSQTSGSPQFVFGSGFDFKFDFSLNASASASSEAQVSSTDVDMADCEKDDDVVSDMDVECDEPPQNKRKKRTYESAFDPVRLQIDNLTFGFSNMSLFCPQTEADIDELCIGIDAMNFLGHSRMDVDKKETQRRVRVVDDEEDEEMTDVADYQALKRSRRF